MEKKGAQLSSHVCEDLISLAGDTIGFSVPMAKKTTLKIGGPADAFFQPTTIPLLRKVIVYCSKAAIPIMAVGGGSNLLVRDGGIRGVVVSTRKLRGVSRVSDAKISVESGTSTGRLLKLATEWELGGVEFLGGVPGSVGGGLIMNAGTYVGEFVDVTETVESLRLQDGEAVVRNNKQCGFSYRHSTIPKDEIVVKALLALKKRSASEIKADVASLRQRRLEREPRAGNNAGSIFKNPPGDYAGRLIEQAGLKGRRIGGIVCSPEHANWLVNTGGATAAELLQMIEVVREEVHTKFGVNLQLEVKVVGEDD